MMRTAIAAACALLAACKEKATKDCASNGFDKPTGALESPWKELDLPLAGGTVCSSSPGMVVFSKGGDWIAHFKTLSTTLEGKGWKLINQKMKEPSGGDQGGTDTIFRKEGQEWDLHFGYETYPAEIWKDKPFSIRFGRTKSELTKLD